MTPEWPHLKPEERAQAIVLLLDLAEDLEALRSFAWDRPRPKGLRPVPEWVRDLPEQVEGDTPKTRLRRWANVFSEELDVVTAARNSVAHAFPIADEDLLAAVRTAARLLLFAKLSGDDLEENGDSVTVADARITAALNFAKSPSDS